MTDQTPVNRNHSLGRLRPTKKTKPRSPGSTGKIYLKRDLLLTLMKQLEQSQSDEIAANIAGWIYEDAAGEFMTVEISAKFEWRSNDGTGPFDSFH